MTNIIETLGSLKGEMDVWDGVFTMGSTMIMFNLAVQYFKAGNSVPHGPTNSITNLRI